MFVVLHHAIIMADICWIVTILTVNITEVFISNVLVTIVCDGMRFVMPYGTAQEVQMRSIVSLGAVRDNSSAITQAPVLHQRTFVTRNMTVF